MAKKILFVDDEPSVLDSFTRQLRKRYDVMTAGGGADALRLLDAGEDFAVVVSDMRMPGMDGVQLLAEIMNRAPDTVRIMLTGNADMDTAIDAINQGNIFRFLTKPCKSDNLGKTLDDALEQHRLITAEKDLLEMTLRGTVNALTDILAKVSPTVFSRSFKISCLARKIAVRTGIRDIWQIEIGAMLSHLGEIELDQELVRKVHSGQPLDAREHDIYRRHPETAYGILAGIPRLDLIARMIEGQNREFVDYDPAGDVDPEKLVALGAQIIRLASEYDALLVKDGNPETAMAQLEESHNPALLHGLKAVVEEEAAGTREQVGLDGLVPGMVFDEDVISAEGIRIVSQGQEVQDTVLDLLRKFIDQDTGERTFRVIRVE